MNVHTPADVSGSQVAILLEGVSRRFGDTTALDNVSLVVRPGEVVGLLGPSGSGKSTLFRCLTRLVAADAGRVVVADQDMRAVGGRELRRARRGIGLIFQQFNLVGRISALDNTLSGRLGTTPTWRVVTRQFAQADRQLALAALDTVGLLDKAYQRADSLSGGQQQRVAIARVLAQQSKVLLADEPVASLDPDSAEHVLDTLRDVARRHDMAVLCALHQVDLARRFMDRIVALKRGRLMLDVPVAGFDAAAFDRVYRDN